MATDLASSVDTKLQTPARPRVAEFFAGIGLMRLGLESEGWRVVFANDNDPRKRRMYADHFGDPAHYRTDDVCLLRGSDVPDIELATASFPCNDLSLAGPRAGLSGRHSSMFWQFARILEEMGRRRPEIVLLENVLGFLKSRKGQDLRDALLALNGLGYRVDLLLLDSQRFVPQSRVRLFVVGQRGSFENKAPLESGPARPPEVIQFIRAHPEVDWFGGSLPTLPERRVHLRDVLEALADDAVEWWSPSRAAYLLSQMSPAHFQRAREMMLSETLQCGTVFRRMRNGKSTAELRADGVAGCLRTPRGGSARQILFVAGRGAYRARLLTPRENARLMGADDFVIRAGTTQALFGFGDAVCVPVVRWIARHCLNPLLRDTRRR